MQKTYCYPIQEILSTYDYGFKKDTQVITVASGHTEPVTAEIFNAWTGGTDYNYVAIQNLKPGDRILGAEADSFGGSTCFYQNSGSDITFGYTYRIFTVHRLNCLFTNRIVYINANYSYIPDQRVLVFDGTDFRWKKAYEIVVGDQLIGANGQPVDVTTTVYEGDNENCTDYLFYHVEIEESVKSIALFNGDTPSLILAATPFGYNKV